MGVIIKQIVSNPIDSNCFILHQPNNQSCIIIDPGAKQTTDVCEYIQNNNLKPEGILLTHEHFDHIWSVESLRNQFDCKLFASKKCSDKIIDSKKNLSLFYNNIGFKCESADVFFDELGGFIDFSWIQIQVIFTPGHTEGSVCFSIEENLFSGDTILENIKTVVKLPGGNKYDLVNSVNSILNRFDSNVNVYPGHGKSFLLSELEIEKLIN
ncbi:MBL fold metallo-hydrolase [Marinifilum flexuosum]|uniref:MBL fold metallo-hydrolase n=1 Tax=Marinifilum flexuosum TaxID=1117708 RepID=UPI0024946853|nr:MBL fold metallo-hydrolase [Marinifilum flexuosum]